MADVSELCRAPDIRAAQMSLTLTLSRRTDEGSNVEARSFARQRSAKNYWVQGSPLPDNRCHPALP